MIYSEDEVEEIDGTDFRGIYPYGPGPFCPNCGSSDIHKYRKRNKLMKCKDCNLEFRYTSE